MYFLIGAIVSTVVLVIPSLQHLLEETIAFSGGCSPDSLHPSQADQPSDPSVPRGRPCCARDAPPCPRPPPHLPRPCPHHCHLDLWHPLDIHCWRPCGGFGDQVHQIHARPISLVDAMVSARVVVVTTFISLTARDNCDQVPCVWLLVDHPILHRLPTPRHSWQCRRLVFLQVSIKYVECCISPSVECGIVESDY